MLDQMFYFQFPSQSQVAIASQLLHIFIFSPVVCCCGAYRSYLLWRVPCAMSHESVLKYLSLCTYVQMYRCTYFCLCSASVYNLRLHSAIESAIAFLYFSYFIPYWISDMVDIYLYIYTYIGNSHRHRYNIIRYTYTYRLQPLISCNCDL